LKNIPLSTITSCCEANVLIDFGGLGGVRVWTPSNIWCIAIYYLWIVGLKHLARNVIEASGLAPFDFTVVANTLKISTLLAKITIQGFVIGSNT
jgi:hypothetical protein